MDDKRQEKGQTMRPTNRSGKLKPPQPAGHGDAPSYDDEHSTTKSGYDVAFDDDQHPPPKSGYPVSGD